MSCWAIILAGLIVHIVGVTTETKCSPLYDSFHGLATGLASVLKEIVMLNSG